MVKAWGPSTPQFFQALCTNETLKSVLFEFVKTAPDGEEYVYHTVRLVDAAVVEIDQYLNAESSRTNRTTSTSLSGSISLAGASRWRTRTVRPWPSTTGTRES